MTTLEKLAMSVEEVAKSIGVSTTTIYKLVKEGKIPHKKIGGRIVFHRNSIESWLQDEVDQ